MIAIGIDPGLDGAVAILDGKARLGLHPTPVLKADKGGKRKFDLYGMRDILYPFRNGIHLVVIEQVGPMPKQGVTSVFRFGEGYGMWQGLLAGLSMSYQSVTPQAWKKAILAGTAKDKQAAIQVIQRRFPGVSLLATPRSKVPHDGMADASCLALYARTLMNGKVD